MDVKKGDVKADNVMSITGMGEIGKSKVGGAGMAEGILSPPARLYLLACGYGVRLHFRSDSKGGCL